ncbi:laccase domain protein [Oxalicibacterium flavum]|uniref:Purine nucleoside phosphorylase n=1 Tax=Oxalicibacterium flavum TaxID=179467 RepID=A0A8J2UKE5_9BURK|nr:peptidoglycan editing factor PgeF [Oxalicibacterium flavum]GGC03263.1 laccase domain protein [Oxalicibacterium flavum]
MAFSAPFPVIVPQWRVPMPGVGALMTTRIGGVSEGVHGDRHGSGGLNLGMHVGDDPAHVARNRAVLRNCVPAEPAWLTQVHGNRVLDASQVADAPEADAVFATKAGVVCAIMTADCLPVLLTDLDGRVVAAAHAGWRGLAGGVLESTVARMRSVGAGTLQAWLGPAIGPTRFEVGEDVKAAFGERRPHTSAFFHPIPGHDMPRKYLCDIYGLARAILAELDIVLVSGGDCCTVDDPERFFSFRRDGVTGRMAALIWRC